MRSVELTFKEFLIAVLHRWKAILALAAIIAIIAGVFSYYSYLQGGDILQETYETAQNAYEQNLASKNNMIRYQTEIGNAAKEYIDKSLLMQIDPYNKQVASLYISVEVDPETLYLDLSSQTLGLIDLRESVVKSIAERYLILANSAMLSEVLGSLLPSANDEMYLREIIQVSHYQSVPNPQGAVATAVSPGATGIITITAIGSKNLDARAAANAMYAYLTDKKPLITESVAEHTLRILDENTVVSADPVLAETQSTRRGLVADSTNQVTKLLKEIEELNANKPAAPSLTFAIIRSFALGFLLGLVIGLALSILLHLAQFPLRFTLQVQEQLGLRFLGGVRPSRMGILFTRWKQTLTGETQLKNEAEAMALISANLEEAASGARRILVTGTLPEQTLRELSEKLSKEIKTEGIALIPSSDIRTNAEAVRDLAGADAVILVERLQTSRLKATLEEKERVGLAGKPILGYVLC